MAKLCGDDDADEKSPQLVALLRSVTECGVQIRPAHEMVALFDGSVKSSDLKAIQNTTLRLLTAMRNFDR